MKRIVAGIVIAIIGCVSVPSWVDAQPRDGGRGRGTATQGRGRARGGQRRYWNTRRPGYRYEPGQGWYDPNVAIGTAIGTGIANWLFRPKAEPEPVEEEQTDEASLEPWSPGWIAYCKRKYKSFDIKDGRYLSYDGNRYFCK